MIRRPAILLLLGACARGGRDDRLTHGVPGEVAVVRLTAAAAAGRYDAPGLMKAAREAEVATRLMGTIERVLVRAGDRVGPGQVLLTLDAASIEASLRQARAGHDLAARTLGRMERLYTDSAVPLAQLETARAAEAQAAGQVQAAEAEAAYVSLRAPFAGTVTARLADPGDVASPGQPLLRIADATDREIVVGVPDDLATRIQAGQIVPVRLGTLGSAALARVRAVVPGADPASRTVEVRLAAPAGAIPGTTAVAEIPAGAASGLGIADSLLLRRGQLVGAFVVAPDSTLRLRWIRVGRTAGGWAEVLSGLEAGDLVAVDPAARRDGMPVRPRLVP